MGILVKLSLPPFFCRPLHFPKKMQKQKLNKKCNDALFEFAKAERKDLRIQVELLQAEVAKLKFQLAEKSTQLPLKKESHSSSSSSSEAENFSGKSSLRRALSTDLVEKISTFKKTRQQERKTVLDVFPERVSSSTDDISSDSPHVTKSRVDVAKYRKSLSESLVPALSAEQAERQLQFAQKTTTSCSSYLAPDKKEETPDSFTPEPPKLFETAPKKLSRLEKFIDNQTGKTAKVLAQCTNEINCQPKKFCLKKVKLHWNQMHLSVLLLANKVIH